MHDKWTGAELDSLLGKAAFTRREMLVTSLAAGFAAAAGRCRADTGSRPARTASRPAR